MLEQIARAHSIYGMLRVLLTPAMDKLTVEYDATRLSPREVESILLGAGLPIAIHV
jgi:hypothetical protein